MARDDRRAIFEYVAQRNPQAALDLDEEIMLGVAFAAERPQLYRSGRVSDTREIVVRPNYVVVYRIDNDGGIIILRVLHAAQQWPEE